MVNKIVAYCIVICASTVLILLSVLAPWVLSDKNELLANFIYQGIFISLVGGVSAITLASTVNLHRELNKIEERAGKRGFEKTRKSIKRSAGVLIFMLSLAVFLTVIKSLAGDAEIIQSFINGACLLVVLISILMLADVTQAIFVIKPSIKNNNAADKHGEQD